MLRRKNDEAFEIEGDRTWDQMTSLEQGLVMGGWAFKLWLKLMVWAFVVIFVGLCLIWLITSAANAQTRRVDSAYIVERDARIICPIVVRNVRYARYPGNPRQIQEAATNDLRQFARQRGYTSAAENMLFGLCADHMAAVNRATGAYDRRGRGRR